jgi:hypothetical protein
LGRDGHKQLKSGKNLPIQVGEDATWEDDLINSMNIALGGMQANQRSFLEAAGRISRQGAEAESSAPPPTDPVSGMVSLLESRNGYKANVQVIRAADEMMGTLLDTFA